MIASGFRLRAHAALLAFTLLAGLSAVPARAIDPYPGETQEAFAARARLDQQTKLAAADAAAGGAHKTAGSGSSSLGGALQLGLFGFVIMVLGGLRMSRGILGASRKIAKVGGADRHSESFEDRLAERLRELERADALPTAPLPPVQPTMAPPPRPIAGGPRTFGKRAS